MPRVDQFDVIGVDDERTTLSVCTDCTCHNHITVMQAATPLPTTVEDRSVTLADEPAVGREDSAVGTADPKGLPSDTSFNKARQSACGRRDHRAPTRRTVDFADGGKSGENVSRRESRTTKFDGEAQSEESGVLECADGRIGETTNLIPVISTGRQNGGER
jgi:hypothetical protein